MKVPRLFIAVFLLHCINAPELRAQNISFEKYTTENGISQNSGYAVEQTSEGYIWFGTQNGLDRYDSHSFSNYKHTNDSNSICNNFINALYTDCKGNLWVGTQQGLCIYNRFTNKFYSPASIFGNRDFFSNIIVKRIKKATDKASIWIITKENGVILLNTKSGKMEFYFSQDSAKNIQRDLVTDDDGNTWVSTEKDIYKYENGQFIPLHIKQENVLDNTAILQDMMVYNKQLWIGSINAGIFILNIGDEKNHVLHKSSLNTNGLNIGKEITRLFKDKKNNIWIGTPGDGLFVLYAQGNKFMHYKYDANSSYTISSNYILYLFEDAQGILWIGTSGGGFSKYDERKLLFKKVTFTDASVVTSNMVLSLCNTNDTCVYVGTLAGGFIKSNLSFTQKKIFKNDPSNNHSLLHNTVYGITTDDRGLVWLATKAGLCSYNPALPDNKAFTSYAPGNNGPQKFFYSIIKLKKENALLLSGYNGMHKFELTTKTWIDIHDAQQYTTNHTIVGRYMIELPNNHLLICTEGLGLIDYDYQCGAFSFFDDIKKITATVRHALFYNNLIFLATDNGVIEYDYYKRKIVFVYDKTNTLADDVVYAILPGIDNNLWISTNIGLAKINIAAHACKYYDVGYGLQSMEFNTACCFAAANGGLCFGGINGLNIFTPASIPDKAYMAPVVVTGINVMNQPLIADSNLSYIHSITLPYNKNFLDISFATTNFSHSEKNTYAYRLTGVDTGWVNCDTRHSATYTQLKPSTYQFLIKAANSNGDISTITQSVEIIIRPPWWLTWWAKTGVLISCALLTYLLVRQQVNRIKLKEATKTQLLEYELKALHAQMNPHFVFNCLASIKQMILDDDKINANKYLNKFSKLIRQTLEHSRQSFITLSQNNEYLTTYLEMEQLRFNGFFSYSIVIEDGIDEEEWQIPPMMMQPLVENAIWHGLMPAGYKGELIIRYTKNDDRLLCIIDDNGVGIATQLGDNKQHRSYGLKNLQQRLLLLQTTYKKSYSLQIIDKNAESASSKGTKAILIISQL